MTDLPGPGASTGPGDPDDEYTGEMLPAVPEPSVPMTRRQARLASERKRRRNTVLTILSASLVVLAAGVVLIPLLARNQGRATSAATTDTATAAATSAAAAESTVMVLVTHAGEPDAAADSVTLLALNPASGRGAAVFVPVGLLLEVPGIGLDRVGIAQRYGGVELVQDSLADALDIDIDAAVGLGAEGLAGLLSAGGELTVNIGESQLVSADPDDPVTFPPGEQSLDGPRLVEYWTLVAQGEQQLSELPRQQQVMEALLRRVGEDPDILDRAVTPAALDPTSTAGPEALRGVLTELAEVQEAGQLAFGILPVRPFGGVAQDGTATYRIGDEAETALRALLADDAAGGETRVEVRTSDGGPDLAAAMEEAHQVEQALGEEFRVTLGAPSAESEVPETRIVIYEDTPEARERAEMVRDRLGLGTIIVDEQAQTVVDMTIVLGDDFPAGGGDTDAEQDT